MKNGNDNRKKTILLVHNFYRIPGGEDTVFENERSLLESQGHRVLSYTRENRELSSMNPVQKLFFPITSIFNMRTYFEVKKLIRREHIDLVHVHNTLALISPSVYYAAKNCKTPVVQTIHNFRMVCPNALMYRKGRACDLCLEKGLGCAVRHRCYRNSLLQTLGLVCGMIFHRCTGIYQYPKYICLTPFNRDMLLKQGQISEKQVFVKPNFVKTKEERLDVTRKNQVVYVGRLEDAKGIKDVLKAFNLLREETDPQLIICGNGPLNDWCRQYIEKHSLNAIMRGQISNAEVRKILSESRAMIFASKLYEGFPMSILEAYSVGTPVVCADFGNAGSLVFEDITGWKFLPNDTEDLCRAIRKSRDISESVFEEFEKKYSEIENYHKLMEIYM